MRSDLARRPPDTRPRPRVMIVEDETVTAMALRVTLEDGGYEVVAAVATGEDAVDTARRLPIDVVLMDIHLAGDMDGIEAAGQIRRLLNIPVIYLTAYSDQNTLGKARGAEPYGYLVKPYNAKEVRAAIEIALHNAAVERDRRAAQRALLSREKLLQDIIDNSPALIYVKDAEHRYLLVNRRFEDAFGVARAHLRGRDDEDALPEALQRLLEDGERETLSAVEPRHERLTVPGVGEVDAVRFPILDPFGKTAGVGGILTPREPPS